VKRAGIWEWEFRLKPFHRNFQKQYVYLAPPTIEAGRSYPGAVGDFGPRD
jgi:hypothetical protein